MASPAFLSIACGGLEFRMHRYTVILEFWHLLGDLGARTSSRSRESCNKNGSARTSRKSCRCKLEPLLQNVLKTQNSSQQLNQTDEQPFISEPGARTPSILDNEAKAQAAAADESVRQTRAVEELRKQSLGLILFFGSLGVGFCSLQS